MPIGPQGQRRPADAVGCAVHVAQIATGEVEDDVKPQTGRVVRGTAGATARAENLSAETRSEIARKAASVRWS